MKASLYKIVVLEDTRETRPLQFFKENHVAKVKRQKLDVGDYQAIFPDGSLSRTVFERKSIPDLWGTMTRGHNRFIREYDRARARKLKLVVVVEGTFTSVLYGFERSRYPGDAMVKKLWTLEEKYGIRTVFCEDREDMSNFISWAFVSEMLYRERAEG